MLPVAERGASLPRTEPSRLRAHWARRSPSGLWDYQPALRVDVRSSTSSGPDRRQVRPHQFPVRTKSARTNSTPSTTRQAGPASSASARRGVAKRGERPIRTRWTTRSSPARRRARSSSGADRERVRPPHAVVVRCRSRRDLSRKEAILTDGIRTVRRQPVQRRTLIVHLHLNRREVRARSAGPVRHHAEIGGHHRSWRKARQRERKRGSRRTTRWADTQYPRSGSGSNNERSGSRLVTLPCRHLVRTERIAGHGIPLFESVSLVARLHGAVGQCDLDVGGIVVSEAVKAQIEGRPDFRTGSDVRHNGWRRPLEMTWTGSVSPVEDAELTGYTVRWSISTLQRAVEAGRVRRWS